MRICHVSPHLPPDQAANALLPAELGRWSRTHGHDVLFVAHEPAQGAAVDIATLAGPVRWIPRRSRTSRVGRVLRVGAWRLARQIDETLDEVARDADLLHLHSNGLIVEVAGAWARRRRVPYVLTLYGTEIWHFRHKWPVDLFARAYRGAAHVTFYSRGLLDRARTLGLNRSNLSVVYPPVNEAFHARDDATRREWREAFGIRESSVILNVKRLHPLAAQSDLVDAFARMVRRQPDVHLVICGSGALRDELARQVVTAGVAGLVTLTGLLPNDIVARWNVVADAFALPSILEAMPTVAVEALACETPVVSADHPGGVELEELFGPDVVLVPRRDVRALARALETAVGARRRTLPETARIIEERFRPEAVFAAYDRIYERIVVS